LSQLFDDFDLCGLVWLCLTCELSAVNRCLNQESRDPTQTFQIVDGDLLLLFIPRHDPSVHDSSVHDSSALDPSTPERSWKWGTLKTSPWCYIRWHFWWSGRFPLLAPQPMAD